VFNGKISTISWDSQLYEPVSDNAHDVGTAVLIDDAFVQNPDAQMLMLFIDENPDTEKVPVHRCVYIPPMLVSFVLN